MCRLICAFVVRICHKAAFLMTWLNYCMSIQFWLVWHMFLANRHQDSKLQPMSNKWQNQQNDCAPREDSDQPECPVWSESSLCTQWVSKDTSFLHADSEDSDQTGRIPRLICVFTGSTVILLVLSWGGLNSSVQFLDFGLENKTFCSACIWLWRRRTHVI